jgi:hypothetical protein
MENDGIIATHGTLAMQTRLRLAEDLVMHVTQRLTWKCHMLAGIDIIG